MHYADKEEGEQPEIWHRGVEVCGTRDARDESKKKVTSRKQAIAIGLSEARKSGAKVPNPPKKKNAKKKSSTKSSVKKKSSAKKKSSKKAA
jgi:hypothetical protein